jgi:hypothetical protein
MDQTFVIFQEKSLKLSENLALNESILVIAAFGLIWIGQR